MRKLSTNSVKRPAHLPSAELPFSDSASLFSSETNDHYLDYLSLAFAILVTKQVSQPSNDPEAPYIYYSK